MIYPFRLLFDPDPLPGGGGAATVDNDAPPPPGTGEMAPDNAPTVEGDPGRHDALAKKGLSKLWGKEGEQTETARKGRLEKPGKTEDEPAPKPAPTEPAKPAAAAPGTPAKPAAPIPGMEGGDPPELKALEVMKPPESASAATKKHWGEYKTNAAKLIREADTRAKKAEGEARTAQSLLADTTGKSKGQLEALQKQLDEAKPFRAAVDLQADPEFQEGFVKPMGTAKEAAVAYLKSVLQNPEEVNKIDWDSEESVEEAAVMLEEAGGKARANIFRGKTAKYLEAKAKHDDQMSTLKSKGSEILQERMKAQQLKTGEFKGNVANRMKSIAALNDEGGAPMYPFLRRVAADDANNPDAVAAADKHNKAADAYNQQIESLATSDDPKIRTDAAMWAVASQLMADRIVELDTTISELKKELGHKQEAETITPRPAPRGGGDDVVKPTEFGDGNTPGKGVKNASESIRSRFGAPTE